jgi:periplasmic protein TonB
MSRTLFDQISVAQSPRRGSKWMASVSFLLHVGLALAILILPITAAVELPGVHLSLPPIVLATVSPLPPPPATPRSVSTVPVAADAAPLEAPEGVMPEVEQPPAAMFPIGVPGAIAVAESVPVVGLINNSPLAILPPPENPVVRRVGGEIRQPERIVYKAPQYPSIARAARVAGTVILEAIIDAEGVVRDVKVLRSVPMLDGAAVEAVRQWRYIPTRLNGVAIPVMMSVTVTFALR